MRSVLLAILLASMAFPAEAKGWAPAIGVMPPGGIATISVEGVRHGDRRVGSNLDLRVRSDTDRAAILVKLDGQYLTVRGLPFISKTTNPTDVPQWEFVETRLFEVPLRNLEPGVHHLEIRSGIAGSSLPLVNEQDIWFEVGR